jgi:Mce-associated membrane protein
VKDDETPSTAADIRALADQAEAEAAEAEALAAAARARARAIQLRRQAEVIEAKKEEADKEEAVKEEAAAKADAAKEEAAAKADAAKEEAAAKADAAKEKAAAKADAKPAAPAEAAAEEDAADSVQVEEPDASEEEPEETEAADEAADESESDETEEGPAEVAAEATADTSAADDEQPARRWRRVSGRVHRPKWSTIAASVVIIVIIAALAASGYMYKEHRDAERQRQHAAEFAAAARQGVVTLTSLDFNDAKDGVQHILENSTGSFKDDFIKMADDFTKVVQQSKVISQGSVQAAAVDLDTMTNDSAVVLVASTSEITNAAGAKQDPRNYRLIVTVARDGGQLKISKVEFVP